MRLVLFVILTFFVSTLARAEEVKIPAIKPVAKVAELPERSLGSPKAPLVVTEYASMTCPHCAAFYKSTLPLIKKDYIDKGRVRFVYKDFPLDDHALYASGIARCAPEKKFFPLIEEFFKTQNDWATATNWKDKLREITMGQGVQWAPVDACLKDGKVTDALVATRLEAANLYNIQSTPSFIVEGQTLAGAQPYDSFVKVFEAALLAKSGSKIVVPDIHKDAK